MSRNVAICPEMPRSEAKMQNKPNSTNAFAKPCPSSGKTSPGSLFFQNEQNEPNLIL